MRAVVFSGPGELRVDEIPEPACGPDDVIVRVAACGLCGTDLRIYRGEYMAEFPVTPGHEFCGTVVDVGNEVSDIRLGDRVTADPNIYCRRCHFCRDDQANHCLNWQGMGVNRPGALAEYVAVPARACYQLPRNLTDTQGALVEPLACVVYALTRLPLLPADKVLVCGAGPMGLLLLQSLRYRGASQVAVVEPQPQRLALARQLGAAVAVPSAVEQRGALQEIAPYGFDIVVDATGVPAAIEQAFGFLKARGRFLQFGVAQREASISFRPYDVFRHDWTIIGTFATCFTFQAAIDWLCGGGFSVEPLVSDTLPLAEFASALRAFEAGTTLKVHLRP